MVRQYGVIKLGLLTGRKWTFASLQTIEKWKEHVFWLRRLLRVLYPLSLTADD